MDLAASFCIFGKNQAMNKKIILILLLILAPVLYAWPQKFLTQAEIYHYEPGDEFHTIHYYCCNDLAFQLEVITITEKFFQEGLTAYVLNKSLFDFLNSHPPQLIDTSYFGIPDTLVVLYPDSILFDGMDTAIASPELYNGRIQCSDYFWFTNTLGVIRYAEGLGKALQAWKMAFDSTFYISDSLVYYKKGAESWGNTLLTVANQLRDDEILMAPNPTSKNLRIRLSSPGIRLMGITIMNSLGAAVKHIKSFSSDFDSVMVLDCSELAMGSYFIYFSTNKGTLVKKFIKL